MKRITHYNEYSKRYWVKEHDFEVITIQAFDILQGNAVNKLADYENNEEQKIEILKGLFELIEKRDGEVINLKEDEQYLKYKKQLLGG